MNQYAPVSRLMCFMCLLLSGCAAGHGPAEHPSTRPAEHPGGESMPVFTAASLDGRYQLEAFLDGDLKEIPSNEVFDLVVRVTSESQLQPGLSLRFDAAMPHHGHGMNVAPLVHQLDDGRFRIEGVLLHMPGRWETYFDIDEGGLVERVQHNIVLD